MMSCVQFSIAPLDPADARAVAHAHAVMQAVTYAPFARGNFVELLFSYMDERVDEWLAAERTAIAQTDRGGIVGVAMVVTGPEEWETAYDPNWVPAATDRYLSTLFTMPATHGTGLGQRLLDAVLAPDEDAYLWTMPENPRAVAFHTKQGFRPDGHRRNTHEWGGMDMIRMLRLPGIPLDLGAQPLTR